MSRLDDIEVLFDAVSKDEHDPFKKIVIFKLKQILGEIEALEALLSASNEAGILFRLRALEKQMSELIIEAFPTDPRDHGDRHRKELERESESKELALDIKKKSLWAVVGAAVPFIAWAVFESIKNAIGHK